MMLSVQKRMVTDQTFGLDSGPKIWCKLVNPCLKTGCLLKLHYVFLKKTKHKKYMSSYNWILRHIPGLRKKACLGEAEMVKK